MESKEVMVKEFCDFCCDINPVVGVFADACVNAFGDVGGELTSFMEGEELNGAIGIDGSSHRCQGCVVREDAIRVGELNPLVDVATRGVDIASGDEQLTRVDVF